VELKDNNFSNAVTFAFHLKNVHGDHRREDYGEHPSIKFFINGIFQVTGPKSATELVWILHHTCDILTDILNFPFEVEEFSVNMINTTFYVDYPDEANYAIDKRKLCGVFKSQRLHSNVPSNHQSVAVNIKRSSGNGIVTIYVFPTSKIIITGGKCGADIKNAYTTVMDIIDRKFGTFFVGRQIVPNKIVEAPEHELSLNAETFESADDDEWDALPKLPPPTPMIGSDEEDVGLPPPSPRSLFDGQVGGPRSQNQYTLLDDEDMDKILSLF
jgi:TATA-box binding protein (TBP) (component of TFIID and TFIIIB)